MGANKPDENTPYSKFDYHDKAMVVAFDVEHIVLTTHLRHRGEVAPYVSKVLPLGFLGLFVPTPQRICSFGMLFTVFSYNALSNYVHIITID